VIARHLFWAQGALLVYVAVFGTAFALLVPPFEAPDEPAHLAYVDFVATRAALPNQYDPQQDIPGVGASPTEGHQPPLYYAAAALLLRLARQSPCLAAPPMPNPLHAWNGSGGTRTDLPLFQHDGNTWRSVDLPCLLLLRECSVLLGVLNVAAVLALSRHFFAGGWALVPGVLAGTLPQVLFSSGVVTNDGLANLLASLCLLCAVRLLDDAARRGPYLVLGLTLGLALLTKKTSLFLVPALAVLAAYLLYRRRRERIVAGAAAALGVAALVCGWWFLRNRALYGDVLGSAMEKATLGALVQEKGLGSAYFTDRFPIDFTQSLVGRFGWMQVPLPDPVYWFYALLAAVSVAGLPLWARSRSFPAAKAAFAGLCLLSCFAGIIALNLTYSQPQGRFLFPVLGPLAVFLTAGLRGLWALLARSRVREIGPVGVAGLVTGLIAILVFVDIVSVVSLAGFYS
jgi:hypothetical protein